MINQWPLIVASLVIMLAAALGLYRREVAVTSALNSEVPPPLPTASATPERTAPASTAPTTPAAQPKRRAVPPPEAAVPVKPEAPVAIKPTLPVQAAPATPAPQNPEVAVPKPRAVGRFQVLLDLQEDLKTRLQMVPIPLNNGGYKFSMDGAHLEVITTPSWQIMIYNINPKQPEVETDSFKTLLAAVVSNLGINTNQKPVEAATGKSYLRTVSKMGAISLERDPAAGNSALIRPMTPTAAVDVAQPAPAVPATPAAPANPAAPTAPQPIQRKPAAEL